MITVCYFESYDIEKRAFRLTPFVKDQRRLESNILTNPNLRNHELL